jgi:hypothetical protein
MLNGIILPLQFGRNTYVKMCLLKCSFKIYTQPNQGCLNLGGLLKVTAC